MSAQPPSDTRWQQRFAHFLQALSRLAHAVELAQQRPLSELEQQGLIQSFEYTHELAWNVLKDFLSAQGVAPLYGSKDTTREAFKRGLILDGSTWMDMITSRNLTSHTYDEDVALEIAAKIISHYFPAFQQLRATMQDQRNHSS